MTNREILIKYDEILIKYEEEYIKLMEASRQLYKMVCNVLTDSQLDHEQCGTTIRKALALFEALIGVKQ